MIFLISFHSGGRQGPFHVDSGGDLAGGHIQSGRRRASGHARASGHIAVQEYLPASGPRPLPVPLQGGRHGTRSECILIRSFVHHSWA